MDMSIFSWLTGFFKTTPPETILIADRETEEPEERERARDSQGRYIPDDPDPPENEAYK